MAKASFKIDTNFQTPVPVAQYMVEMIPPGAKTILERGKGHFTTKDGVTALPSALSALLKMSS